MARDYKHRANQNKKDPLPITVSWWKWTLVIALIGIFVSFLVFLNSTSSKTEKPKQQIPPISKKEKQKKTKEAQDEPRFDFYTILPETEVVVPDYEIDTRSREEQFGKSKSTQYLIQAGSFKDIKAADKLRANLALMGIESKIQQATIGNMTWNRVIMGPYSHSSSVSSIKKKLRKNGIDTRITEIKE